MSQAIPVQRTDRQRRALMVACLALGIADLAFIDGVALPRLFAPASLVGVRASVAAEPILPRAAPAPAEAPPAEAPPAEAPPAPPPAPALALTIHFATRGTGLTPRARTALDALIARGAGHPGWTFAVQGHADARGDAAVNQRLSEVRARVVAARLEAAGLPRARVQTAAFGSTRPVTSGDEPEDLRRNRRVEILIVRGAP